VRCGLTWSIVILLTLGAVSQLSVSTDLLGSFTPDDRRQMSALVFVATLISIGAILLIYEKIYGRYGQQLRIERESFYNQAHTDKLTGLANLRGFEEALQLHISATPATKALVTLMYMDLDGFKNINDTLGHDVGDWLLKEVAVRMASYLRSADVGARLGGDEFAIIITGLTSIEQSERVIGRLYAAVSAPAIYNDKELPFGVSMGYATYPIEANSSEALVRLADQAMYQEKRRRKSRQG
jgi:diguanylate cyclase (GGDEF)-like protein